LPEAKLYNKAKHATKNRMFDLIFIPSPYFDSRKKEPILGIVAHCLGHQSFEQCVRSLTTQEVSAHYFIPACTMHQLKKKARETLKKSIKLNGMRLVLEKIADHPVRFPHVAPVIQLVKDQDRAWHAGKSHWSNWSAEGNLNACTLGIEVQSIGYADGLNFFHFGRYRDFQVKTTSSLMHQLVKQHHIDPKNIVAHSDIAWDRQDKLPGNPGVFLPKTDPGPTFFWQELAHAGLGILPQIGSSPLPVFPDQQEQQHWIQKKLIQIGYTNLRPTGILDALTARAINAFRMHFLFQEASLIVPHPSPSQPLPITATLIRGLLGFETYLKHGATGVFDV
jgi:N-acetyl-anhydromuramyl-L-alanine amidase AmpD